MDRHRPRFGRNSVLREKIDDLERFCLTRSSALFTVSQVTPKALIRKGVDASRITVVPNCAADVFSAKGREEPEASEDSFDLLDRLNERRWIGYIGSIQPWQGVELLVDAWSEIAGEWPDVRLLIVSGRRSPAMRRLMRQARNMGSRKECSVAVEQPLGGFVAVPSVEHAPELFVEGDWPAVKGYYRLIDHPDESAVKMDNILLPHRERTIRRMKGQKSVLCIQDGSDLNYSGLDQCEGLGVTGSNQTGAKSKGLHLHSTLAVTTDGLPLGVLKAQCPAPVLKSETDDRPAYAIPIEENESFSWILGLRDCMDVAKEMPHTRVICVMDREADFFELFDEHRRNPCVDLLVRAQHNRCTTGEVKLFEGVGESEVRSRFRIHVERQSARPKKSKQKARPKRPERTAEV